MKITICKTEKKFIQKSLKEIVQTFQANKKAYHIALSGGSTPVPIYKALATLALPFDKTHFYQTDERFVPATHKDSNQKMQKNIFSEKFFHAFNVSLPITKSLKDYSEILPSKFDLTILGIGPDGHVASLFPHSKALRSKAKTAHATTDQFAIKDRLTLTFPPIIASKKILVLLKGPEKLAILEQIKNPSTLTIQNFPAKKILAHPNLHLIFCTN